MKRYTRCNKRAAQKWLKRDIFEQSGVTKRVDNDHEDERLAMLSIQYRMHPDIVKLINQRFYKGLLKTDPHIIEKREETKSLAKIGRKAVILCDTSSVNPRSSKHNTGSRINEYTAIISKMIAEAILNNGIENIGIITPYKQQAKRITGLLEDSKISKTKVNASTIHKFQGNQRQCIIIDLVDGPPNNVGILLQGPTIKSEASRLLNVAISRAESVLIIIANRDYFISRLSPGDIVYDLMKDIDFIGETIDSKTILPPSFEHIGETKQNVETKARRTGSSGVKESYLNINDVINAIRTIFDNEIKNRRLARDVVIGKLVDNIQRPNRKIH